MNALHCVLTALLILGTCGLAGADDSWVGQKVMKRKPDVKFGVNGEDGQKSFPLEGVVHTVLKEKDGWLRFRGEDGKEGWASKEDFVLLADAPAFYTDLIKENKKNAWAWNSRGVAWSRKGELENAIKDYTELIRLRPKDSVGFNNRGSMWEKKKEYDKAIEDYDEAIYLDPKFAIAFYNRGIAWHEKQEYDKAIKDYDEALRLNPIYAPARLNRGRSWNEKKNYDKPIKDFDEAIRLDPSDALAFLNRGDCWRDKKEYDKAIKDFDEAIRLDPKDATAFCNRGVSILMSRRPKATADFQSVLDIQGWKGSYSTYAAILGHLSSQFEKDVDGAKQFLAKAEGKLDEAWPYPVVKYLRVNLDEPALMKLATDDDKRTGVRCYLGLDSLLKGNEEKAREHFRWVKEKGDSSLLEHTIAIAELDRLDKAKDK